MFKLIWGAVVGGGPTEWAILGLGAVLALGGAFGAGYAVASNKAIKTIATVASTAGPKAAAAQHKEDVKRHDDATKADPAIRAADKKHDNKAEDTYHAIIDASAAQQAADPAQKSCVVPMAVLKELNKAGEY